MIRICNFPYHGPEPIVMGEKAPYDDRRETHGLCPICLETMKQALEPVTDPPTSEPDPQLLVAGSSSLCKA